MCVVAPLHRLVTILRRHPRYSVVTNSLRGIRNYLFALFYSVTRGEEELKSESSGSESTMVAIPTSTQPSAPNYYDNLEDLDACTSKGTVLEGILPYTPRSAAVEKVYKSKGKLLVSTCSWHLSFDPLTTITPGLSRL